MINCANAGVAELADARDLKSRGINFPYRFDPGRRQKKDSENTGNTVCSESFQLWKYDSRFVIL